MLKDRRALLEQEIKKANAEAANMYLSIVIGGGDVHDKNYHALREKITNLNFDLAMINKLISEGQE